MSPLEEPDAQAKADILISFEGNEITFSAESEAADRWIRYAYAKKLDSRYARIKKFAQATFVTPHDEQDARGFQQAAKNQGLRFY